ncbi:unnamed protein product, partial [Staurois parvus]
MGGVLSHHWCQWEELCPIFGANGKNCPIIGVSGRNYAPWLMPVGGIMPHGRYQWRELCPITSVNGKNYVDGRYQWGGRNYAPLLVSLGR